MKNRASLSSVYDENEEGKYQTYLSEGAAENDTIYGCLQQN